MSDGSTVSATLQEQCATEIKELHQFFEAWLAGDRPETASEFDRATGVLASGFCLVGPSGSPRSRETVLKGLRSGYGAQPELEIEIRNVRVVETGADLVTATYEEWQRSGTSTSGRFSTVVFRRDDTAPSGLRWVHVHETWMQ